MRALLEEAIAYEVADKAIPSISCALFDTSGIVERGDFAGPGVVCPTSRSQFRIGSISKMFTALAVMREVEAGRLDLDADVSRYLGTFDPQWEGERAKVTLRRLLSHRSGLTREAGRGHYLSDDPVSLADSVNSLRKTVLKAAPDGETFRYSNAGYALIGACIEAASGRSYGSYLATKVLAPLGLETISAGSGPRLQPAKMWGLEGDREAPRFNLGCVPAGGLVATIDELAQFGRALLSDPVIVSRERLAAMWQVPDGSPTGYGQGFMIGTLDGHRTVGHGGVVYGYASELVLLPEAGLGIAMVATLDATNETVIRLCRYALGLVLAERGQGKQPAPPPRLSPPTDRHLTLAGWYEAADRARIELRAVGGELVLIERLTPLRIRPLDARRFALDGRLRGEGTAHPSRLIEWDGVATLRWRDVTWRRVEPREVSSPFAAHLGIHAPHFLPSRLTASGNGLCCVLEEFFPHDCVPLGGNRFRLGRGMYEDEILELSVTSAAGKDAIRVGDMVLERLS
ncbi:MAG: serine hydrolase domain-containing protein [Devosia sp.]